MNFSNILKNLLYLAAAVVLAVILWALYKKLRGSVEDMEPVELETSSAVGLGSTVQMADTPQVQVVEAPLQPLDDSFQGAPTNVQGVNTTDSIVPIELLPNNDAAAVFAKENPGTNVQDIAYLSAGFNIGMDTRGGTMKNPSLDVRGEIPIEKSYVGPFANSSYEQNKYGSPLC